ncbi:MAG: MinD/ParA family protein [Sedimentisphaerales bacterium]|nr:MinD/ParA family protein [Sedimentisphaerales bacterium]
MTDQAVNLHLSDAPSSLARVIAVTSGKGGVGKTNIAANLAICLARLNKRVVLLDADISLANVDVLMDLRGKYDISQVIGGHKSMSEVMQPGPNGLQIICGASGLDRLADLSEGEQRGLLRHLSELQQETDTIVVDTAAGISRSVVGFCLASDHVLVVTTPEATAMTDAYGMIKVLARKRYQGPISIVVNMARDLTEGKRTYQRIADVARKFLARDLYFAAVLPRDDRLLTAVRSRKPVVLAYPNAQVSSALAKLAARLSEARHDRQLSGGFFRKVAKWWN